MLTLLKLFWVNFLFILFCCFGIVHAQDHDPITVSVPDTNAYGNIELHNYQGWKFSFDDPVSINRSTPSLSNTVPVNLKDFKDLKTDSRWFDYGWFELEFEADSSIAGVPWILSYTNPEPVNVWLNGVLVLKNGNPSKTVDEEVRARVVNPIQTGVIFGEGINHLLIEYSGHKKSRYYNLYQNFDNGIYLMLFHNYEPSQRRHRAFLFGGAFMLLALLVLFQSYLAVKFPGQYHIYVLGTTLCLMVLAFTTLSDTLVNWSYDYMYFFEYSYTSSIILVVYFYALSIRSIFELSVPRRTLSVLCILLLITGLISVNVDRNWMNVVNPLLMFSTLTYSFYTIWQVKKKKPETKVWIIATGLIITVLGGILYLVVYLAFGINLDSLLLASILLAFTGIPISLTFNVAVNYVSLIGTLESKVRERTVELESASEYQNRFFANISHEFRTPLTISGGLIDKLMKQYDGEPEPIKLNHNLSVVKRNLNRLNDMVDQIIDLTKSDQSHLSLNKKYYKADGLVSVSVESFRSLAEYHGHHFEFIPDASEVVLNVDRSKTEIMINNLISNAIKFSKEGGSITVRTSAKDSEFSLTVQDAGPGIPEGQEEIIFERFHRIKRADEDYVEGMGVGLELSRTLARLHGGDIIAEKNIEVGAVFRLTLPIERVEEAGLTPIEESLDDALIYSINKPKKERNNTEFEILLVEDNEDMMEYVAEILSELGTITKARNGKEALTILEGYKPDIIVTDLMMPMMGGLELVEVLKKNGALENIPVVVLTAKALEADQLHLLRIGVVDYITKPFKPEQLVLKTRNLLNYYIRRKEIRLSLVAEDLTDTKSLADSAAAFISKHLSNTNLSVDMLASEFSQSRRSFYRNLQVETGMSPGEFIREVRLTTARSMIASNKNLRLEELATAVGYKSATSFRKVYEERFGEHPLG